MRALIKEADPDVVEEWKWMGTPVWSHDGGICTGESYKSVVKLTFVKGASLKDPAQLFNSSLDGNVQARDRHPRGRGDRRGRVQGAHSRRGGVELRTHIAPEMKVRLLGFAIAMLSVATPSVAHRLNEYLQATTIGLEGERLSVQLRLTPGVDIVRNVIADIDVDADGVLSEPECQAYAERVRLDVRLSVDNRSQPLRLVSSAFEPIDRMLSGQGEIVLLFDADKPRGAGPHTVSFVNHHWPAAAAYLVNVLQPGGGGVHIDGQHRTYDQSEYRVDFRLDSRSSAASLERPASTSGWRRWTRWLCSGRTSGTALATS